MISEALPQKKLSREIVKGDKVRKDQLLEAEKTKTDEKIEIKKKLKKIEGSEKKLTENIVKKTVKKKPLTKKKK